MAGGIFISYRRNDSDFVAGRLAEDLSRIFGPESIFRDIDRLEPGVNYIDALDSALNSCAVLIAIIGPYWSTISDEKGHRRLDDPQDWVRIEISRAIARNIRLIPVLISGAKMPQTTELPDDLKPLISRHAVEIVDRFWKKEVEELRDALSKFGIPQIDEGHKADLFWESLFWEKKVEELRDALSKIVSFIKEIFKSFFRGSRDDKGQ